jgi:hypothetical protein
MVYLKSKDVQWLTLNVHTYAPKGKKRDKLVQNTHFLPPQAAKKVPEPRAASRSELSGKVHLVRVQFAHRGAVVARLGRTSTLCIGAHRILIGE